jgi:hypothetical protein
MNHKIVQYDRVLPRDAFNESKLLKCIGQLTLFILDWQETAIDITYEHKRNQVNKSNAFEIVLLEEGSLMIVNLYFKIHGTPVIFKTQYNSKRVYPMFCEFGSCDYPVFDDRGQFDQEFIDFCNTLKPVI